MVLTSTGSLLFFLGAAVLVYWLRDKRLGLFLGALLLTSGALNAYLEALLRLPRPSVALPSPTPLLSNGFPCGHAQTASALWPGFALAVRGVWIPTAALLTALVAFSRVYLGVHFVGDVLGGWPLASRWAWWGIWRTEFHSGVTCVFPQKLVMAGVLPVAFGGVLSLLGEAPYLVWGLLTGLSVGYVLEGEWVGKEGARTQERGALRLSVGILFGGSLALVGWRLSAPILVLSYFCGVGLTMALALPWASDWLEKAWLPSGS